MASSSPLGMLFDRKISAGALLKANNITLDVSDGQLSLRKRTRQADERHLSACCQWEALVALVFFNLWPDADACLSLLQLVVD